MRLTRHELPTPIRSAPLAVALALAAALAVAPACSAGGVEITLDPKLRLQTSAGWEVGGEIDNIESDRDKALPYYRDALIALAVDQVGANRLRLEVRSGSENTNRNWRRFEARELNYDSWRPLRYATVNDNDDPNVINWSGFDFSELDHNVEHIVLPMQKALAARGERLFVNLCYVSFIQQTRGARYDHDDPREYAEFVLATYLHLKSKWGLTPDTWEVILEPDLVGRWNGKQIGERIVATARLLEAHGFKPRFVAPSVADMANAAPFIDGIASAPGAMGYVQELSYHRYKGVSDENLAAIVERARRYGKGASMLEWWFGNANYEVLHKDLTAGENVSWQGRVVSGLVDLDTTDLKRPKMKLRQDSRMNAQYFRYIRFGARRIGASSSAEGRAAPVAYVNPNGAYAVVVKASKPLAALTVRGLPAGDYKVSYATKDASFEPERVYPVKAGEPLTIEVPAAGVLSLFDARLPPGARAGTPRP